MRPELPRNFSYKNNQMYCESVPLQKILDEVGSPVYVYSKSEILTRIRELQKHLPHVHIYYAVKASSNLGILKIIAKSGCGADIVSGGELFRCALSGFPSRRIVFSGVGKTIQELMEALSANICMFNIESVDELHLLESLSRKMKKRPLVSLRVNPNVEVKTHPYISTGLKKNKFGLSYQELKEVYDLVPKLKYVKVVGLSCHIGSQIQQIAPLKQAWKEVLKISKSTPFKVTHLDLGGGLGIPYQGEKSISIKEYAEALKSVFKKTKVELGIEPGRSIVAPAGVLLTRLTSVKKRGNKQFYVLDAGMNDLIRPALYQARHEIFPLENFDQYKFVEAEVVGPVCESSDIFLTSTQMPVVYPGSGFAVMNAGAYGMSMSSQYNSRTRAAEVLVDRGKFSIIRERETYADLIQNEIL